MSAGLVMNNSSGATLRDSLDFFKRKQWQAFAFQKQTRRFYLQGKSGLIHSATGTGKTIAALLGPIQQWLDSPRSLVKSNRRQAASVAPLHLVWLTPLRSLAADTELSIRDVIDVLDLPWSVERRTSDVSSSVKKRQRERLPTVLVTTPESLSVLLTYPEFRDQLGTLKAVIVDEWHELLGTKRGVQAELVLTRLSRWCSGLQRWGLSATLGNLDQALATLVGKENENSSVIVRSSVKKKIALTSLLPQTVERFPWAGHLGFAMSERVAEAIEAAETTLVFTNTRNQTELWYQELLKRRPSLAGQLALHHGSLDTDVRRWVEQGLKDGKLKAVVCTSSLDLGVDFTTVDQVIQVGSPKGAARMLQRAGRSGHTPGAKSHMLFVPTNALELVELAAVRDVQQQGRLESRVPLEQPLDVLAQHLITVAIGEPFADDDMYQEIRQTYAYRNLSRTDFDWVLNFVVTGGQSLQAYDDYKKVEFVNGCYVVQDARVIRQHRYHIGTITSEAAMQVRFLNGQNLGNVEEFFIAKLQPGDRFLFAGKLLELVRIADNAAWVRRSKGTPTSVPRWQGGRLPLSTQLADAVRDRLQQAKEGQFAGVEMKAVQSLLELQARWSEIPGDQQLLIEYIKTRDGHQLFVFPFAGRLVHEGLSSLLAYRLAIRRPITFHIAINDYGLLLHSFEDPNLELSVESIRRWFSIDNLMEDCLSSLNVSELGRRQFREIARIAGLIQVGQPGRTASSRHLQATSNLFYDVFREYDPGNLLLEQTRREVLQQQLEWERLYATLERIQSLEIAIRFPQKPTPLAFPLLVDRLRQKLSTETLADRVKKMQQQLEQAAS